MKNVQKELNVYLENAYFRLIPIVKSHGIDVEGRKAIEQQLRDLLETIPPYISIEDYQYDAIVRWINTEIFHTHNFSQQTEIGILTYINSCYASRDI